MLHQIGAGALGPVFRAYQPEQDRLVAVKLFRVEIPPERSHQMVAQLERLIAADLTHPGIAAPLATGLSEVFPYLAMDFVAADSLDMVIRDQALTAPSDAVRVALQLAGALDLAAAIDITHGALHPRDILLSADDVRMTGIGIARALQEIGSSPPIRRPYAAPERTAGAVWDRRADVFSLAALVFELLTRRRISGPGDQPLEAYSGVTGVSADALDKVFDRGLAERPSDRFATAGDFARALQGAVEKQRPASSRLASTVRPIAPPPVAAPLPSEPEAAEELPLFTDSLLGLPSEAAAADALPPPIADVEHESLESDPSFRDAPLSMVESLHEPDLGANGHGRFTDDLGEPHDAHRHRLSIDDFTEAVRESPSPPIVSPFSAEEPPGGVPSRLSLQGDQSDFAIEEVFAREGAEPPTRPVFFETVAAPPRSSSGVWPLMLALVVGIALGFGIAMLLLGRDRVPAAPQQATTSAGNGRAATEVRDEPVREVTEQTVPQPQPEKAPEAPRAVANTPVPVAVPPTTQRPAAPSVTTSRGAAAGRSDNRIAKTPPPRPQSRTPVSAAKPAPTPTKPAASTRPAAGVKGAAVPSPGRTATKTTAATPAGAAAQTPEKAVAGSLTVDSRPSGANVFIDGRRVGTTPLVLPMVNVGQYTIGIDLDGYQRWATTVRVTSGERSRVAASLER